MAACPQCGNPVDSNNRFCPVCGRDILGPPAAVVPPQPVASTTEAALAPVAFVPTGPPQTSGKAVASLVLGIFFFVLPSAILAIIFGHISLSDIKRSAGRLQGRGLAITGLVLGYAGIAFIPVLLIIAAIAIPSLLKAKIAADEASALASLRAVNQAEVRYDVTYGGYACRLEDLGGASGTCNPSADHACLIDDSLASGRKNGYIFQIRNCAPPSKTSPSGTFGVVAYPQTYNSTGARTFCSDETAVIRFTQSRTPEDCFTSGEPFQGSN